VPINIVALPFELIKRFRGKAIFHANEGKEKRIGNLGTNYALLEKIRIQKGPRIDLRQEGGGKSSHKIKIDMIRKAKEIGIC